MKKIETMAEYQLLASRTCPDLGGFFNNMLHMHLGVVSEVGEVVDILKKEHAYGKELDRVHLGEELADMAWYFMNKDRIMAEQGNYEFSTKYHESLNSKTFFEDASSELDVLKDYVTDLGGDGENKYSHILGSLRAMLMIEASDDLDNPQHSGLKHCENLAQVAYNFGLDFWQILTNNIAKLKVRYPDKFTNEAALNRNLEAERKELEKESDE